jgi:hypothetical protein
MGLSSLVPLLPEIILIFGGLLILMLDATPANALTAARLYGRHGDLFLAIGLVGVIFQLAVAPQVALLCVDVDPFFAFPEAGRLLEHVPGGVGWRRLSQQAH